MKIKTLFIPAVIGLFIMTIGCSNSNLGYENYAKDVKKLSDTITETDKVINELDAYDEGAVTEFLKQVDNFESEMKDFSKVNAPSEFDNCEILAKKADESLMEASRCFHESLEGEYDNSTYQLGVANYNNAVTYINYMGLVLQGQKIEFQD